MPTADLITSAIEDSYSVYRQNERLLESLMEHQSNEALKMIHEVEQYQQFIAQQEPHLSERTMSRSDVSEEMPQECWDF